MAITFIILLLLVAAPRGRAQPSPPSFYDGETDPYRSNFNALTVVLIVAIVSAFFLLAFFSLYFRRCSRHRSVVAPASSGTVTATSRRGDRRGLDPAVIETFPTLSYSAVTGIKIGKETLECAVCLSEFSDGEALRMLPRCCHVFHPECIDTWLESHATCPVCRDNLSVVPVGAADGDSPAIAGAGEGTDDAPADGEVAIDVARLGRSQSTGHVTGPGDRFTLRLPEHVRREIVAAGSLRRSASVAVFGGSGEGSSRRGRSVWAGVSDRWASGILMRVSTWRRGEAAAEGALRGGSKLGGVDAEDSSNGVLGRV